MTLISGGNLVVKYSFVIQRICRPWLIFSEDSRQFCIWFSWLINGHGHQRRKIGRFLSCFLAVYISNIRSIIHDITHRGNAPRLRNIFPFPLWICYLITLLVPSSQLSDKSRSIALCVTMPHKLVFERGNEVSLTHGIVGIRFPRIVRWVRDFKKSIIAVACWPSTNVIT